VFTESGSRQHISVTIRRARDAVCLSYGTRSFRCGRGRRRCNTGASTTSSATARWRSSATTATRARTAYASCAAASASATGPRRTAHRPSHVTSTGAAARHVTSGGGGGGGSGRELMADVATLLRRRAASELRTHARGVVHSRRWIVVRSAKVVGEYPSSHGRDVVCGEITHAHVQEMLRSSVASCDPCATCRTVSVLQFDRSTTWSVRAPVCTSVYTHQFNGHLSETTRASRYQKGKPIWILLKQETASGSGIRWAICKSAPRSRQITTPAPHHSVRAPVCLYDKRTVRRRCTALQRVAR